MRRVCKSTNKKFWPNICSMLLLAYATTYRVQTSLIQLSLDSSFSYKSVNEYCLTQTLNLTLNLKACLSKLHVTIVLVPSSPRGLQFIKVGRPSPESIVCIT